MNQGDAVSILKGVGDKKAKLLLKLGIATLRDLLYYMPRDYETPGKHVSISGLRPDGSYSITAVIRGNPNLRLR